MQEKAGEEDDPKELAEKRAKREAATKKRRECHYRDKMAARAKNDGEENDFFAQSSDKDDRDPWTTKG